MEKAKSNCFAPSVITDKTFEEAPEEVDCPVEVLYIWNWFTKLDATRQSGMGIGPITFQEIRAWSELMRIDLLPFEVEAIRKIDTAYIVHQNTESKKKRNHG